MVASLVDRQTLRDDFVAELADAALQTAAQHGVRGASIDQELELWHALRDQATSWWQGAGTSLTHESLRRASFVAAVTDAAYRVALSHGFQGSFIDFQLDLWKDLCQATRTSPVALQLSCRPLE
jgi:hypothetical protein